MKDLLVVLETMRSPLREIARVAALTLMRLTEIRTLRREYVHLEQGVVMLPQAKAGARPVILRADGAQPGLHRVDRDGPRRVEDGADDAAVCRGDGSDAEGGGRSR